MRGRARVSSGAVSDLVAVESNFQSARDDDSCHVMDTMNGSETYASDVRLESRLVR